MQRALGQRPDKGAERTRIGIVIADPLRAVGAETILREHGGNEPVLCDLRHAVADRSLRVLLLDDHVEGGDVGAVIKRLRAQRPDLKLIVLGEAPDFAYIQAIMDAGVQGYLLETTTEAEIHIAVDAVLKGAVWAPKKVLARLIVAGRLPSADAPEDRAGWTKALTAREAQVLELLIGGSSNREIGGALGIDEVTVKAHLGRMLRKTRCKNRVELSLRALQDRAVYSNAPSVTAAKLSGHEST